jgi:hypothetical protein
MNLLLIAESLRYWLFPVCLMIAQAVMLGALVTTMRHNRKLRMAQPKYGPFWQVLETAMGDLLHHPHPESRELDKLLEELANVTLTKARRDRLEFLLSEKAKDPTESKDERNRAEFLLFAMREVVKEKILMEHQLIL